MKKISVLKLKQIVDDQLNFSDMGHLVGGVNEGISVMDNGCTNYVCTNDKTNSEKECTSHKCTNTSCTSGA